MRVAFMGSPEFAVPALAALADRHEVVLVVSQPDKPAGRGRHLEAPAVKRLAALRGLPVAQPRSARTGELADALRAAAPDVAVVVAYGKILPAAVLAVPPHGCLNIHGSLLPAYRGAAPIQWAIIRGERETGITIMRLDEGMDTGPMLLCGALPIAADDTAGTLAAKLAPLGAALMLDALVALAAGTLVEMPQDHAAATYAPLLRKEDGVVDWAQPAVAVRDRIRGVDPWPTAVTGLGGEALRLFRPVALAVDGHVSTPAAAPGEVVAVDARGLVVACGDGLCAIGEVQAPGRKRMPARAFAAGRGLGAGARLEAPPPAAPAHKP